MIKAVARAFRWRRMLETGRFATINELAAAESINSSYVSRVLRLTLLAPPPLDPRATDFAEVRTFELKVDRANEGITQSVSIAVHFDFDAGPLSRATACSDELPWAATGNSRASPPVGHRSENR